MPSGATLTRMRYGLLADVHSNLYALDSCLEALEGAGIDRYLCAGDVVGYGPQPNECVERIAALDPLAVAGNHDLIAIGALPPGKSEPLARESLEWTRAVLSRAARTWLSKLPRVRDVEDVVVCHGTLDDPTAYMWTPDDAKPQLDALTATRPDARVVVFGHTHIPALLDDRGERRIHCRKAVRLERERPVLLNPGSVGQSRQAKAWARCAVLDTDARTATFFRLRYDVAAVRTELARRGRPPHSCYMPPSLAHRAWSFFTRSGA